MVIKYIYLGVLIGVVSLYGSEQEVLPQVDDQYDREFSSDEIMIDDVEAVNVKPVLKSALKSVLKSGQSSNLQETTEVAVYNFVNEQGRLSDEQEELFKRLTALIKENYNAVTTLEAQKLMIPLLQVKVERLSARLGHNTLPNQDNILKECRQILRSELQELYYQGVYGVLKSVHLMYLSIIRGQDRFNELMHEYRPFKGSILSAYTRKNNKLRDVLCQKFTIDKLFNYVSQSQVTQSKESSSETNSKAAQSKEILSHNKPTGEVTTYRNNYDVPCILYIQMAEELKKYITELSIKKNANLLIKLKIEKRKHDQVDDNVNEQEVWNVKQLDQVDDKAENVCANENIKKAKISFYVSNHYNATDKKSAINNEAFLLANSRWLTTMECMHAPRLEDGINIHADYLSVQVAKLINEIRKIYTHCEINDGDAIEQGLMQRIAGIDAKFKDDALSDREILDASGKKRCLVMDAYKKKYEQLCSLYTMVHQQYTRLCNICNEIRQVKMSSEQDSLSQSNVASSSNSQDLEIEK